ncbi:unnamed protein product [Oppiella nova]|uniref:Uncharacterized protein n=1 Tax=Oppiella nova TaxID=334625 RepID=A0A7R9MQ23_9ACAR|nr:unnamed protein product [Oppiella nova]CAG2180287.1 unnamed protein product [Oppiella nova]
MDSPKRKTDDQNTEGVNDIEMTDEKELSLNVLKNKKNKREKDNKPIVGQKTIYNMNESVEELRSESDWKHFHTSTSTPTSLQTHIPDLNVSSISYESNDSDMLLERQLSHFQITDEIVESLVLEDFDTSDDLKIFKSDLNIPNN